MSNAPSSSCSAVTTTTGGTSYGANAYGGSMSVVYVGAYAWSLSNSYNSSSTCGATTASGVSVSVSNAPSSSCSAATTTSGSPSYGANAYGGSMSLVYIGGHVFSFSNGAYLIVSASSCNSTQVARLSLSINSSTFSSDLALSRKFVSNFNQCDLNALIRF